MEGRSQCGRANRPDLMMIMKENGGEDSQRARRRLNDGGVLGDDDFVFS